MTLTEVENQILMALAVGAASLILFGIQRFNTWMGIKLSADKQAALTSAVDKVMTLGVSKTEDVIKAKGWDHVDSKNAVINFGLSQLESKFPDALQAANIDLNDATSRQRIIDMMTRMIPDVFARAASSPATPPADTKPTLATSAASPTP